MRVTTKHAFIEELECRIALQLQQNLSPVETFRLYQSAFSTIIDKFERHAEQMRKVKDGYDSIIDNLFAQNRRAMSLQKKVRASVSNLEFQLFDTQEKIDIKKANFRNVIEMCRRIIGELREDIVQQEQELREGRVEFQIAENRASENAISLAVVEKKLYKIEIKRADHVQMCDDLQLERNVKVDFEVQGRDDLEHILDQICDRTRTVRELKVSIADLQPRVEAARQRIAERRQLLEQELPTRPQLQEELSSQYRQIEAMVKENEETGTILRVELGNIKADDRMIAMHREDLVRLAALYISRMNGYRDGIDPARFPDLA
jgi:chromosome segregation ATPase